MQGSHAWRADSVVFDEDNLVSHAGLVPLLALAERAGLSRLLGEHVRFVDERVKSGAANSTPKLTSIIAGMAAGADSIDDLDVIRSGGMKQVFGGVYASATLGIFLREFTHGHTRQLSAVLRRHLVALAQQTPVLDGIGERAFVDIDSLLRPVYGHAKQGASFGHTKIAGRGILRRGLSPLAATIATPKAARPWWPRFGCARDAPDPPRALPVWSPRRSTPPRPLARTRTTSSSAATPRTATARSSPRSSKPEPGSRSPWPRTKRSTPRSRPSPTSGTRPCTTRARSPTRTRRPDLRRPSVRSGVPRVRRHPLPHHRPAHRPARAGCQHPGPSVPRLALPPVLHQQPEPTAEADITHRRHAICETVWSDLIDGPWAHQPSGSFPANAAWSILAAITHNLLRAAGTLTGKARYAVARGATLRTHLINIPARLARPQRRPVLHLPAHWPRADDWLTLWRTIFVT